MNDGYADGDGHHSEDDRDSKDRDHGEGHHNDHAQSNGNAYAYGHSKGDPQDDHDDRHDDDHDNHRDHDDHDDHRDHDNHEDDHEDDRSHDDRHHQSGHHGDDGHHDEDGDHHDGDHSQACDHNPPPCFVKGTLIETPDGAVPVERLGAGDRVVCADGSVLPILWAGGRVLDEADLIARPHLRPVVIRFGSLCNRHDLRLSPQHAVALHTPDGMRLARAKHLARRGNGWFRVAHGVKSVSYHHLLLPRHALLLAEGAVVESMWPGPVAMAAVGPENRADILRCAPGLKPALDGDVPVENVYGPRAAPMLSAREVRTMARIEAPAARMETRQLQPAA